jgi:hypothetical protein
MADALHVVLNLNTGRGRDYQSVVQPHVDAAPVRRRTLQNTQPYV